MNSGNDPSAPGMLDRNSEFMRLFACHCEQIRRYIGTLLSQVADADEVFQQTSITLWRNFEQFDADRSFVAWACGVALNHVRNYRRVESRRPVFLLPDDVLEVVGRSHSNLYPHLEERRSALVLCMEKLSAADRTLVVRCYGDSDRPKDAAAELGRPVHAIYRRLNTIRRQLFDCINRTLAATESE